MYKNITKYTFSTVGKKRKLLKTLKSHRSNYDDDHQRTPISRKKQFYYLDIYLLHKNIFFLNNILNNIFIVVCYVHNFNFEKITEKWTGTIKDFGIQSFDYDLNQTYICHLRTFFF